MAFGIGLVREMERLQQERRQKYHSEAPDVGDTVEDDIDDAMAAATMPRSSSPRTRL